MNNVDTHTLLVSKENIQPLKQGRDTSKLCVALEAQTNSEIQQLMEKQRNEYEIRLRMSGKEDPLSDWCDYIHWIEQSFPKQPREGKLHIILQKCLNKFKDCEKYKNDIRFVKLCIKYADMEGSTVELLSQIHRHGIGIMCAEFYVAWAEKLAMNNCFKKANAIYEKGIEKGAAPIEMLKEAQQSFHAFLFRRMYNAKEEFKPTFYENVVESRQPYNILQPIRSGQTESVSHVRIGPSVKGSPGKLKMDRALEKKPKSNTAIKIFQDIENEPVNHEPQVKLEKIPNKKNISKENTVRPGPWTDKSNKKVPFTVGTSSQIPFQVHRDEENEPITRCQTVPGSVLKTRSKNDHEDPFANVPLFYPEPYDSSLVPMYCKEQVYAGGLEFQFEELRAIHYRRKKEEEAVKNITFGARKLNLESPAEVTNSERCEESESRLQVVSPETENILEGEENEAIPCKSTNSQVEVACENAAVGQAERRETFAAKRKGSALKPKSLPSMEPLPTSDYSMNQTIHTKEALSEMQQLWFSKPASPLLQDTAVTKQAGKSILKPAQPCFNLYIDESCLDNFKKPEECNGPLDLTFKGSSNSKFPPSTVPPEEEARKASEKEDCVTDPSSAVNEIDLKVNLALEINSGDDENKENNVPGDYCGPVGKSTRRVTGILTPSEDIAIVPLSEIDANQEEVDDEEEQEEEEEEEEIEKEEDIEFFRGAQCNMTGITETWNLTKAFQFPRNESTPNPIKSSQKRQDVNRSLLECDEGEPTWHCPKEVSEIPNKLEAPPKNEFQPKRSSPRKEDIGGNNLSVIAETSREYKSSSSGSIGVSTFQIRSFKNCHVTPADLRVLYSNATDFSSVQRKSKGLSLTGYEASGESTDIRSRTPMVRSFIPEESCPLSDSYRNTDARGLPAADGQEERSHNNGQAQIEEEEITHTHIDPFDDDLIDRLLKKVRFSQSRYPNLSIYSESSFRVPKVGHALVLDDTDYVVKKIREGSYAKVCELVNQSNGNRMIAKVQKPPFPWEFHIITELHKRIKEKEKAEAFMKVDRAFFYPDVSILLMNPVGRYTLLDAINFLKESGNLHQEVAIYFTVQILKILDTLHSCKIIHADIKPDNILILTRNRKPQLQLIDFGRSIDMTLFPEGTTFTKVITTDGFTTTEMKSGKPWTYQVDLFGAANCAHCLLFGDYMKVEEKRGVWNIRNIIPRYWARAEWSSFFLTVLNIESCDSIPTISSLIKPFEAILNNFIGNMAWGNLENFLNRR